MCPRVADPDRHARLGSALLYLCTPARPDLEQFLDAALSGGVDVVRLRQKGLDARDELELCEVVADVAARHGALWTVNDRADLAYVARPDGLQLGPNDLPVAAARYLLGDGLLIGASAHDLDAARAALATPGVDHVVVGPALPRPWRRPRPGAGLGLVRAMAELDPPVPWFADGGIRDLEALEEVLAAGARRVVVVRALVDADDPHATASQFKQRLLAASAP